MLFPSPCDSELTVRQETVVNVFNFYTLWKVPTIIFISVHHLLPPANVVCEGYVLTSVCLSTGGGVSRPTPGGVGIPACTEASNPPPCSRRLLMRAIRILLECILVFYYGHEKMIQILFTNFWKTRIHFVQCNFLNYREITDIEKFWKCSHLLQNPSISQPSLETQQAFL